MAIPRQVHLCWLSGDPFPPLIDRCIASWRRHLPDYRIVHWDAAALAAGIWPRWVHEATAARKYAFAADYIRLYALHSQGGIYLDADVQVLKTLDDLLESSSFMGRERGGDLEPAVMGAVQGLPWLKDAMGYYEKRPFLKPDGTYDQRPLPIVLADVLAARYGLDLGRAAANGDEVIVSDAQLRILPAEVLSPKCRMTGSVHTTTRTCTIHHFDGQWVDRSLAARLKLAVHRLLIRVLGIGRHAQLVRWIRAVRSS